MPSNNNITQRRVLNFNSIDDCLAEVARIAAADSAGSLRTLGNWTAGQNLSHLAAWIEYGYHGFPLGKPPWRLRVIMRLRLPGMLKNGMSPGAKIPGAPGGTYGAKDLETQAAADRYRAALSRLKAGEPANHDSPAFGPMSEEKRVLLNLRHAELHLGFLCYD